MNQDLICKDLGCHYNRDTKCNCEKLIISRNRKCLAYISMWEKGL